LNAFFRALSLINTVKAASKGKLPQRIARVKINKYTNRKIR
jgi:hypothetical protein